MLCAGLGGLGRLLAAPHVLAPAALKPNWMKKSAFGVCFLCFQVAAFPFVLSLVLHHCVASSHVLSVLALDNCWHQVLSADPDEEHSCSDSGGSEEEEGSDYDYDDDFINDGTESESQYDSEGSAEDVESD
eukprot:1150580-Pelagomonas_calceolata.AAC.2